MASALATSPTTRGLRQVNPSIEILWGAFAGLSRERPAVGPPGDESVELYSDTGLGDLHPEMELYASGLNAWGQLGFGGPAGSGDDTGDVHRFASVLGGSTITYVRAYLSHTIVGCNGADRAAGYLPGDHAELYHQDPQTYSTLAEASNGSVAIIKTPRGAVQQFSALRDFLGGAPGQAFPALQSCVQVVAYDAGFAALTSTGSVYTWGDERYEACLGREVTEDSPAETPGQVTALLDLPTGPVSKIAAGGYILAALTAGSDLYLWGGHPGRKTVPVDIDDEPAPVVIDDQDIADVAVGEAHLIVLTSGGSVFAIGDNRNGQLGLPVESSDTWSPVELPLQDGRRAVAVTAGPRNSFITVTTAQTSE